MNDIFKDDCKYFRWKYDKQVFNPNTCLDTLWAVIDSFRDGPTEKISRETISAYVLEVTSHERERHFKKDGVPDLIKMVYALGFIDKISKDNKIRKRSEFILTNNGRRYLDATPEQEQKILLQSFLLLCRPFQRLISHFWGLKETESIAYDDFEYLKGVLAHGRWNAFTIRSFITRNVTESVMGHIIEGVKRKEEKEIRRLYLPRASRNKIRREWFTLAKCEIARNLLLTDRFGLIKISEVKEILGRTLLMPRIEVEPQLYNLSHAGFFRLNLHMRRPISITMTKGTAENIFNEVKTLFEVVK